MNQPTTVVAAKERKAHERHLVSWEDRMRLLRVIPPMPELGE